MSEPHSRCIALYPGAFRPPHTNHLDAVLSLTAREDVDHVVVIISNRARVIADTAQALDVEVAERIWALYLREMPNVTVEVAPTSAVRRALEWVRRGQSGDKFLLAVGAKDYAGGRGRFSKLAQIQSTTAKSAEVIPLPEPKRSEVSGTLLRSLLAQGEPGMAAFVDCLPDHLSIAEQSEVWDLCRNFQIERAEAARRRIVGVLDRSGLPAPYSVEPTDPTKPDSAYTVTWGTQPNGQSRGYVKYANDGVSADSSKGRGKSRRRLKVEARALHWIDNIDRPEVSGVSVPQVLRFESETRTLVLGAVIPSATTLRAQLEQGSFDLVAASALGGFLGALHGEPNSPHLWGDAESDQKQWLSVLGRKTRDLETWAGPAGGLISDLRDRSIKHATQGFRHLDLEAHNVLVDHGRVGVIDFENSTAFGDCAVDPGTIVGWFAWGGMRDTSTAAEAVLAIHRFIRRYRLFAGRGWEVTEPLIIGFAGLTLLQLLSETAASPDAAVALLQASAMNAVVSVESAVSTAINSNKTSFASGKSRSG